ncbi:hypothetical protein Tco_0418025 [Tanacetum coccineum]
MELKASRNPLRNLYNHPFCDEMRVKPVLALVSRRTGVNRSPVTTYYIVNGLIELGKCSFSGERNFTMEHGKELEDKESSMCLQFETLTAFAPVSCNWNTSETVRAIVCEM